MLPTALIMMTLALAPAMGYQPVTASVRVSSGALYDYVVIGEHPKATDGYDNAYDTVSPGNLNADMGEPYISAVVLHPGWKPSLREMRGDIRALAPRQEWRLKITSSLPAGTPLTLEIQPERTRIPKGIAVTVRTADGKEIDLQKGNYTMPAPKPSSPAEVVLVVVQPKEGNEDQHPPVK
ncbi:hypothetical protein L4X63_21685 [Geomonas sp. Red32]|uniref:hypothetical protein n=1 Tax=Geomonas sp. Red32 TaxID=2912856 RepID=UPI00202CC458|nr:hypothetical protein [Geomonas sp. Red32]MCM0084198.1 hypothetical protein [Geomonas sp. Red32]